MLFDYISDIHIDKQFDGPQSRAVYKNYIENILCPSRKSKYLLLAGDVSSSFPILILFLRVLSEYYDKIFFCFGNNDFYMKDNTDFSMFDNSNDKVKVAKKILEKNGKIVLLEGDYYDLNGIRIAGACGWTNIKVEDGETDEEILYAINKITNAFVNVYYKNGQGLIDIDSYNKWKNLRNSYLKKALNSNPTILITHFPHRLPKYVEEKNDLLYLTKHNVNNELNVNIPKVVIAGHLHIPKCRIDNVLMNTHITNMMEDMETNKIATLEV